MISKEPVQTGLQKRSSKTVCPIEKSVFDSQKSLKSQDLNACLLFYPIICVLKVLGVQPLHFRSSLNPSNGCQEIQYEFRFKSLAFIYSITVTSFLSASWILFIFETFNTPILPEMFALKHNKEELNITSIEMEAVQTTQQAMDTLFAVSSWIQSLNMIRTCPTLVQYFTNWSTFEKEMMNVFQCRNSLFNAVGPFRNILVFFTFIIILSTGVTFYHLLSLQELYSTVVHGYTPLAMLLAFLTTSLLVISDVRYAVMLRISEEAFRQIKQKIRKQIVNRNEAFSPVIVQSWLSVIKTARNQIVLSSRIQGTNLLIDIIMLFSIWCLCIFQFIIIIQKDGIERAFEISGSKIGFCCLIFIRPYLKAILLERMIHEEYKIAQTLRTIDDSQNRDISTKLEREMLIDFITITPTKINIANLFTFDRKLLFGVFGQVATYLLVLLQFFQNVQVIQSN